MAYDIDGGDTQRGSDTIYDFQELRSGKYTLWDHTFEFPDAPLQGSYNFLLEVAGVTPDPQSAGVAAQTDWFAA